MGKKYDHHPKQYVPQRKEAYTKEERETLCKEFEEKQQFLKRISKELPAEAFVRYIFPEGFEEINEPEGHKPNLLLSYIRDDQASGRSYGRIVFDDLEELRRSKGHNFVVASPVAHSGRKRTERNAYTVNGFAIDLDKTNLQNIKNLLYQMQKGILPPCSILVNSGTGVHVYYVFDKPIPALKQYEAGLTRLKKALSDLVWNKYTSGDSKKQSQGIFQGFRVPETQVKFSDQHFVTAYEVGGRVSLKALDAFIEERKGKEFTSGIDDPAQHLSLEQHKVLHPEWYQRRIVEGKAVGEYSLTEKERIRRRKWYDAWIKRLKAGAYDGNRYHCTCVLFVYALKAEIPFENAMDDAINLIEFMNSMEYRAGNEFTVEDVEAASAYYDRKYITMSFAEIERKTGIKIPRTERREKPLSRAENLAYARAQRDTKAVLTGKDWREGNGRPDKRAEVFKYILENGVDLNVSRIAKNLGMSRTTVTKYVKEVEAMVGENAQEYGRINFGEIHAELSSEVCNKEDIEKKRQQRIKAYLERAIHKQEPEKSVKKITLFEEMKFTLDEADLEIEEIEAIKVVPEKTVDGKILKECLEKDLKGEPVDDLKAALEQEGMLSLYEEVERPLSYLVEKMMNKGVKVDTVQLNRYQEDLKLELSEIEQTLYSEVGKDFNPNSPAQVAEILYGEGSKAKTDADTLRAWAKKNPDNENAVTLILSYRSKASELGDLKAIKDNMDENGVVHPNIDQLGTETGRFSMSKPNLQAIPKAGKLRKVFVPEEGKVFLSADYSQLEMRVLAHLSEDPALIAEIQSGDIHSATARAMFGESITAQQRAIAKAINFGIIYGESEYGLAKKPELELTAEDAKVYIDRWNAEHKVAFRWLEDTVREAKKEGKTHTLYGRVRVIEGLRTGNFKIRKAAERAAKNAPVQGTAADIAKIAMLELDDQLKSAELDARIVLQVHDEIVVECRPEDAEQVADMMHECMTESFDYFKVPLEVSIKQGTSLAIK